MSMLAIHCTGMVGAIYLSVQLLMNIWFVYSFCYEK